MIKLKNILLESQNYDEESFQKLEALIQQNDYIETTIPIYRGVSSRSASHTNTFMIRDIRTDRKSRDSGEFANLIFNKYIERFYPQLPTRNEILFASLNINMALEYASSLDDNIYVILPSRESKITAYTSDTLYLLDYLASFLVKDSYIEYIEKNELSKFEMIYEFFKFCADNDMEKSSTYFINRYPDIIENANELKSNLIYTQGDNESNKIVDSLKTLIVKLNRFYTQLLKFKSNLTIIKNNKTLDNISITTGTEIWIAGKSYCMINNNFYLEYKKWKKT